MHEFWQKKSFKGNVQGIFELLLPSSIGTSTFHDCLLDSLTISPCTNFYMQGFLCMRGKSRGKVQGENPGGKSRGKVQGGSPAGNSRGKLWGKVQGGSPGDAARPGAAARPKAAAGAAARLGTAARPGAAARPWAAAWGCRPARA